MSRSFNILSKNNFLSEECQNAAGKLLHWNVWMSLRDKNKINVLTKK